MADETRSAARVRLRYRLVVEYDARIADYEGADSDPKKMAAMDLESVKRGDLSPYDFGDPVEEGIEVVHHYEINDLEA